MCIELEGRGGDGKGGDGKGMEGRGGNGREIGGEGRGRILEGRGGKGREGREGGKLHRRYPDEGTGQCTVCSIHKPSHNAALALETLVLQIKNSEQV